MAKKNTKHPLGSKYHSAIEPKRVLSVQLSSSGSLTGINKLGQQAVEMAENSRLTSLSCSQGRVKERIIGGSMREQMTSEGEIPSLVAAKAAKSAAKVSAAVKGQSKSLLVLPEIIPFDKFTKREKLSVKVAVVDWKNRKRPDVRSSCFSSLSYKQSQTDFHVGIQKVNEWSLDLIDTCGDFDSLKDRSFGVNEDYISPPTTPGTSKTGVTDNEQRTVQLQYSESDHIECAKAERKSKDVSNDLSLGRDKVSLRDSCDEFEYRSLCGPESMGDCRSSSLECSSLQGQPSMGILKLRPNKKLKPVNCEGILGLKPMRTSDNPFLKKIKTAVLDYVVNLLTPVYKTRKIQKDDFKLIVKKTVAKVMERDALQAVSDVSEFLNTRRKTKIRALVDKHVEMRMSPP